MSKIAVLDQSTINQIAAGEVVERPASVVKELIENAIDAGANAITAEIKEGGISFIRITDNGAGIDKEDIPLAFLRHSTSKIRSVEDLLTIGSLGFRGEALSSIAAVAQVELITKTRTSFTGVRYVIEGGEEKELSEIGCPDGTTFLIRNLFYNTPARRKFLKSPTTEAGYISDLLERLSISHPNISFKFINNNKTVLHTSGNHNLKDIIYHVYGRDVAAQLVPVVNQNEQITLEGYVGKPIISRGNRNYENYFINGRYIKSAVITKAIEEAYKPYSMQHKYPFTAIHFTVDPELIDVNVHPTKMEIRFTNTELVYKLTYQAISMALSGRNMIPDVSLVEEEKPEKKIYENVPEPFEKNRLQQLQMTQQKGREELRNKAERKREEAIKEMNASHLFSKSIKDINVPMKETATNVDENVKEFIKDTEIMNLYNAVNQGYEAIKQKKEELVSESTDSYDIKDNNKIDDSKNNETNVGNADSKVNDTSISNNSELDSKGLENKELENKELENKITIESRENNSDLNSASNENINTNNNDVNSPSDSKFNQLTEAIYEGKAVQTELEGVFLSKESIKKHRIIGQLFSTYWLVEFDQQLYIIDQHAAHEKILYEATLKRIADKEYLSQIISPPIVLTLNLKEEAVIKEHEASLKRLGFEIEHFGGKEYSVSALPADMYGIAGERLLIEFIDDLVEEAPTGTPDIILEKIASMSCKAAVKGNHTMSVMEAEALIEQLLTLDNPFHCPHGRPIIISMTKYELEKKFKRII
ncbi:DNA mismatch repair endonuclease MutL [Clostridium sp. Marseille-P299]|uniref:DNA mismatch repair endonuclease MutL n=1 Tax=Clostridium sp. Marseille-P299 TaxID=1805477 RepID=UPI00082E0BD9|nr:DNA mismatch repair endonuclease MutL [Clostridium sp. Marseille-P299]